MPMKFTPENLKWARIAASQGNESARRILQAWNKIGQAKRTAAKARELAHPIPARRLINTPTGMTTEALVERAKANWKTEARRSDFRHVYGSLGL